MITNYDALPLGTYMRIDAALHTPAEDIDKQVEIVAILADMTTDEVLRLPLGDYASMAAQTAFLGKPCNPTEADGKPVEVAGLRLVPTSDFTKITTAQFVDFQTFSRDIPRTIPQLLSVFLVPEGKAYNEGYDVAEVQEAVKSLPLPVAVGLSGFFFRSLEKSLTDSLTFLGSSPRTKGKATEILAQAEAILRSVGAGSPA